ncbi:hypothetical protein [Methylobacterium soli]|uniref:Uncharacterized protein n=1 Tax=Methylobacterium soli TaxID=553447 RepID=A0A6L3T356_9HYPH|nr:hypothetical protein [Methylobacterium soli]KAB1079362.1 hypothetical protein F6X53_11180 [Methylobacterium soli]
MDRLAAQSISKSLFFKVPQPSDESRNRLTSGGESNRQCSLFAPRDLTSTIPDIALDSEPKPVRDDLTKTDLDQRTSLGYIKHETSDWVRCAIEMQFADPLQLPAC